MNVLITILFTFILSLFTLVGQAHASSTSCNGFYGGTYTGSMICNQITIDKKVQKPGAKDYVDNLSALDIKYTPGQEVSFQIVVQNTGSEKLTDIVVADTLPQFVTFVAGPGIYDKTVNKLTFTIESLESGQSQTFHVKGKVAGDINFPEKGFSCLVNHVRASEKGGASAEDTAQFCIERPMKVQPPVLGVKQTPPTGPMDAALPVLISMAGAGMYLTRKTRSMIVKKRGGVTK